MHVHRPYRTAAQHAADVYAMRRLVLGEPCPAGCECRPCLYAADDFVPDMGDPHRPNDERGWWEEASE